MADDTPPDFSMPQPAKAIGFSTPVQIALGVGIFLLLLTGLFRTIVVTSDDPSEGLADTSIWFGWVAGSIMSLALVAAGFLAKEANPGARAALVLVGLYLFQQASNPTAGILSFLSPFF